MDGEVLDTRIFAVGNQSGGVTKTTTVVHLGAGLAERGHRVLLVDADMNCGTTRYFGIPDGMDIFGTFEMLAGDEDPLELVVRPGDIDGVQLPKNLHLIPSHLKLEGIDAVLLKRGADDLFYDGHYDVFIEPLERLRGHYDYIILDTAPNLTTPTRAAYKATPNFVLTTICEPQSIENLKTALKYIQKARHRGNPDLRLMGVVINCVPGRRTRLADWYIDDVRDFFGQGDEFMQPFDTIINASTLVPAARKKRKTMFEWDSSHKITNQYRELVQELEERFRRVEELHRSTGMSQKVTANG